MGVLKTSLIITRSLAMRLFESGMQIKVLRLCNAIKFP